MRVLLTNDDGMDAPGLLALERAFSRRDDVDLWVVAPDRERSACSHGMTLDRPLFTKDCGHQRISVSGLPADCVYLAIYGLLPAQPDLVVSGINNGPNLGTDVVYSGTVAGAREAASRGIHGVAVSLASGGDFDAVAGSAVELGLEVANRPKDCPLILNLNYPAGKFTGPYLGNLGIRRYPKIVHQRIAPLGKHPYYWLGGPKVEDERVEQSDGWLISKGCASATFLKLDQTHESDMKADQCLLSNISYYEDVE